MDKNITVPDPEEVAQIEKKMEQICSSLGKLSAAGLHKVHVFAKTLVEIENGR